MFWFRRVFNTFSLFIASGHYDWQVETQTAPAPSADHCSPGSAAHHTQNTGLKCADGVLWMEVVMRFEGSHSFTFSYRQSRRAASLKWKIPMGHTYAGR